MVKQQRSSHKKHRATRVLPRPPSVEELDDSITGAELDIAALASRLDDVEDDLRHLVARVDRIVLALRHRFAKGATRA